MSFFFKGIKEGFDHGLLGKTSLHAWWLKDHTVVSKYPSIPVYQNCSILPERFRKVVIALSFSAIILNFVEFEHV